MAQTSPDTPTTSPLTPRRMAVPDHMARFFEADCGWSIPHAAAVTGRLLEYLETHGIDVARKAPTAAVKVPKAPAVSKAPKGSAGLAFYQAAIFAKARASAECPTWASRSEMSHHVIIPAAMRSFKTERGTTVKQPIGCRMPVARFWPGGTLPAGVVAVLDGPRDKSLSSAERMKSYTDKWGTHWEETPLEPSAANIARAATAAMHEAERWAWVRQNGKGTVYVEVDA